MRSFVHVTEGSSGLILDLRFAASRADGDYTQAVHLEGNRIGADSIHSLMPTKWACMCACSCMDFGTVWHDVQSNIAAVHDTAGASLPISISHDVASHDILNEREGDVCNLC